MTFYWLTAILLAVGVFLLLDIQLALPSSKQILANIRTTVVRLFPQRQQPLKTKVDKLLGRKKDNVFRRTLGEALLTLDKTGERSKAKRMERSCYIFSAIGFGIGLLMQNMFLAPALGIGLYFIPLWAIKLSYNSYTTHLNAELEIALSQITSSYISSNNLLSAVKENLGYLKEPVRSAFERFVSTVDSVDPNIERALLTLQDSFDSFIFGEWCNALIQCQQDSSLKSTLRPHVNKFSSQKVMQEKKKTGQMMGFKEFLQLSGIAYVLLPTIAYIFFPQVLTMFINHTAGQIVIAIAVAVFTLGINKAVQLAAPFQIRR